MNVLTSALILSLSLSFDALAVGIAYGVKKIGVPFVSKMIICLFSVVYSGVSMLTGSMIAGLLPVSAARLIGIVSMVVCALWLLSKDLFKHKDRSDSNQQLCDKAICVPARVIRDPEAGDMDRSGNIDPKESILLSLALSFDALGAGFGAAMTGIVSWLVPILTGVFQLLFVYMGLFAGKRLSSVVNFRSRLLTAFPGLLLLLVAILRLSEL